MAFSHPEQDRDTGFEPRPQISHVVFDFDGTLSWLRHGWPELMASLFLRYVPPQSPMANSLPERLLEDILSLNGKSSIYQMIRCAERVLEAGGPKLDPEQKLAEYQRRLSESILTRKEKLQAGQAAPDEFVIYGARSLLHKLKSRGLNLVILSGTVEPHVKEEARLLGLADFFGSHIYGSGPDLAKSSKQAILQRLMAEERIEGHRLLAFGDGPVEIALTKAAGGLAVGVASDEDCNGSGQIQPEKAALLSGAGADLLIPDYRDPDRLLQKILGHFAAG